MNKLSKILTVLILFAALIFGAAFLFNKYVLSSIYSNEELNESRFLVRDKETGEYKEVTFDRSKAQGSESPYAVLLLGVDSNQIDIGRSDTIQLALIEPKTKNVTLVPIPRDLYVTNVEKDRKDKINHAYNNGISNTIATIENHFNIPISYYAVVNFNGFIDIVDELGGVEIDVPKYIRFPDRITGENFEISEGKQTLSGIQALNYARYRGDSGGDLARNQRQAEVISALITQTKNFQNLTKINALMDIASNNFKTNLATTNIIKLLVDVDYGNANIETLTLNVTPDRVNGASIMKTSESDLEEFITELQSILEIN